MLGLLTVAKTCFLDEIDLHVISGDEGRKKKPIKSGKIFTCAGCGLNMQCQTPKMAAWGQGKKKIMIVLDTPSFNEDRAGKPWLGLQGQLLKVLIEDELDIKIKRDCWTVYAVRCYARNSIKNYNSEPCRKYLHNDINELDPAVIIPFGYWAMMGVSGGILTAKSRGKTSNDWAGFQIPDQGLRKWVMPTYDPFLLRLGSRKPDEVRIAQFIKHLQNAIDKINVPVKIINYSKKVETFKDTGSIMRMLEGIKTKLSGCKELILALDYETTGRKPHRKGHEIISIALSNGEKAWAFPFDIKNEQLRITFKLLLENKKIKWRVHNLQFEWLWSYAVFGAWPAKLDQDTILGIHALNSQKRKGLKPNIYQFFGVAGYDDAIEEYITASAAEEKLHGANSFNLMKQAPVESCLFYNALDALFTYRLADYVKENLRKKNWTGYEFLMESAVNLVKAQENGIVVDESGARSAKNELEFKMHRLETQLQKLAVKNGWPENKKFRPSASNDIAVLLYDIMGFKCEKKTAGGGRSTDKEVLEKIKAPIAPVILDWKKTQKIKDTYINGLIVEVADNLMHPFFNLFSTVTYRSSSDSFNFQNIPIRDKISSAIIRGLLYPHHGQKINEYDYKGIEVAVSCCYNKDRNLIKYITNPDTDMHRDTGIELFMYKGNPQDFLKHDRQTAKSDFVFAEFYGSYFEQTAPPLWEKCSSEARLNMKKHGIRNFNDFKEHVREVENSFWNDRFFEYAEWKKDFYKYYLKHGYVDSYTGFRYYGPMSKNDVCNYPIQGSAHHVLLWLFNKISGIIEEKKMKTKIIGQIHDSMILSVDADEEKYFDKMIWHYGTQEIIDEWKWILVPLQIEKSSAPINMPWSGVEELGLLGRNGRVEK